MSYIIGLDLVVIIGFCVWIKRLLFVRKYKLPPLAPGSLPVVGHTFSVLADPDKLYDLLIKDTLGKAMAAGLDAVTIRVGTWDIFVVLNIEDGLTILNSCLNKDSAYKFFEPWFGKEGLITAEETIWKRHRRILGPTFSQRILDGFLIEMNKYSRLLVEEFAPYVGQGKIDHLHLAQRFTVLSICATAMGSYLDEADKSMKEVYLKCIVQYTSGMVERMKRFWLHSDLIFRFSKLKKRQQRLADAMRVITDKTIINRKKILETQPNLEDGSPRPKAFLDLLLTLQSEGTFTDSELREEVSTFIAAGSDTTSAALSYILPVIGTYPDVQRRILDELKEVFGDSKRDVEKDDLNKLVYLEAVIKETLRLYPLIPAVGRRIDKDIVLKNYTLPAGSRCFTSLYSINRDPLWGPDAEQFDPDRWLDADRMPRNVNAFATFSVGKRACIGNNYAIMTLKTSLCHLLRHYSITGDVTKMVNAMDIVVKPAGGHYISVERRN